MKRQKRTVLFWNEGNPVLLTPGMRSKIWAAAISKEDTRRACWKLGFLFVDGQAPAWVSIRDEGSCGPE